MTTQIYKLNMIPFGVLPVVPVSQYDDGGRTIQFDLYMADEVYTPNDPVIKIGGSQINCTVTDNSVSFVVDSSLTQSPGIFRGEVIDENNGAISSCNFNFVVDSTPIKEEVTG